MNTFLLSVLNFSVLVAALVYFLRKPIKEFVYTRHGSLRDELTESQELLKKAQVRFDEFSSKIKAIDAEISAYRNLSQETTATTVERILKEATRLAQAIQTDAGAHAKAMLDEFKFKLKSEFASTVLDRAEKILKDRLTGADRTRICEEFSEQLEKVG